VTEVLQAVFTLNIIALYCNIKSKVLPEP